MVGVSPKIPDILIVHWHYWNIMIILNIYKYTESSLHINIHVEIYWMIITLSCSDEPLLYWWTLLSCQLSAFHLFTYSTNIIKLPRYYRQQKCNSEHKQMWPPSSRRTKPSKENRFILTSMPHSVSTYHVSSAHNLSCFTKLHDHRYNLFSSQVLMSPWSTPLQDGF